MKIVCLKGGIGNQIFEYCRFRQLQEEYADKVFLYCDHRGIKQHHNQILSDCFDIQIPRCPLSITVFIWGIKLLRQLRLFSWLYDDEAPNCMLIDDYCQDKKFTIKASTYLSFKKLSMSDESRHYLLLINQQIYPVAIHIRRGDYLHPSNINDFGLCSIDYYTTAVALIRNKNPESHFFLFSDDIEWAKNNLNFDNATYIEHNKTEKDYIDLYLMTQCKAHIIANSTFSYWGSRLTDHNLHICVYPLKWFNNPTWNIPDIFPSHWIGL